MMEAKYRNAAERTAHRDKCETALAGKVPEALEEAMVCFEQAKVCFEDDCPDTGRRYFMNGMAALEAKHEPG